MEHCLQPITPIISPALQKQLYTFIEALKHFSFVENKMPAYSNGYNQCADKKNKARVNVNDESNEYPAFDKINYVAILMLEELGLNSPSQQQIDLMEAFIVHASSDDFSSPTIGQKN